MSWMNGNLDKVQNKYKCSCGAESVHGVYDDENNHTGQLAGAGKADGESTPSANCQ